MKRFGLRLILVVVTAALVVASWRVLFPGPENIIRGQLAQLAKVATVPRNEGSLARLAKAQQAASFFAPDAEVRLEALGRSPQSFSGREEIQQAALSSRVLAAGMKVEFIDVTVVVDSDGRTAVARLTGKANLPGENVPQVEEFKLLFRKLDGNWLIQNVETVKTLH